MWGSLRASDEVRPPLVLGGCAESCTRKQEAARSERACGQGVNWTRRRMVFGAHADGREAPTEVWRRAEGHPDGLSPPTTRRREDA